MISIIIPTYNEEKNIGKLVAPLKKAGGEKVLEIIVSDGGSSDLTLINAKQAGASAYASPLNGRAAQMNFGASLSKGSILYFVHADTLPPETFAGDIIKAIEAGFDFGRFRTKFDSSSVLLKMNAWLTRFDLFECYGGDQTLFIKRSLFEQCKGFNEDLKIMEEYEFCKRARIQGRYKIMTGETLISARKYHKNSWLKVQLANAKIVRMYKKGADQHHLVEEYKKMLKF